MKEAGQNEKTSKTPASASWATVTGSPLLAAWRRGAGRGQEEWISKEQEGPPGDDGCVLSLDGGDVFTEDRLMPNIKAHTQPSQKTPRLRNVLMQSRAQDLAQGVKT